LIRAYPTALPRSSEVTIDALVLLATFGVSTAAGVLFGLAPIMTTGVKGLVMALKEGGATGATGAVPHRLRRGLVIAEAALAVVLVAGAGLLVRTVYNLSQVDAGFDPSRLVTFSMTLPQVNYLPSARARMYQRLLGTLRAVPGVEAATAMSGLPPNFPAIGAATDIDNYSAPPEGPLEIVYYYQYVTSDYFETMGIPIVAGRGFEQADGASTGLVAVVNETLANTFWSGRNPIGQRLRRCGRCGNNDPWFTVIGVARDVKQGGLAQKTGTEVYVFVEQQISVPAGTFLLAPVTMNVMLRTTLPPAALSRTIESVVREADPTVPIVQLRDMDAVFAESIRRPSLLAELSGAFAGLALLLAAIGTYGVLSYTVTERRREIGIRMALGAARSNVLALVMKQGLQLTIVGFVVGVAGALALNRLIASLLFGVQPTDAPTLAAVASMARVAPGSECGAQRRVGLAAAPEM
jgi:predicted permease